MKVEEIEENIKRRWDGGDEMEGGRKTRRVRKSERRRERRGEEGGRDGGRGRAFCKIIGVSWGSGVSGVTLTSPQEQQVKTADDGEGN